MTTFGVQRCRSWILFFGLGSQLGDLALERVCLCVRESCACKNRLSQRSYHQYVAEELETALRG